MALLSILLIVSLAGGTSLAQTGQVLIKNPILLTQQLLSLQSLWS